MKRDSTVCESFSFLKRVGKGNRLGDLAKKWHGAWVGTAARTHELPISPLSLLPFVCLSLSLCPPPRASRVAVFVDCSPAVVIATVMQTARTGCLSAWICQVCVCVSDKTPECSRLREEVFGELCNVLFFFFFLKGEKVKKKKKKNPICPSVCLSLYFLLSTPGECSVYRCHTVWSMIILVSYCRYLYCLFLHKGRSC